MATVLDPRSEHAPASAAGDAVEAVTPTEALATLTQAVQQLSLAESVQAVQRIVRTAARRLTGADGATFVLLEDDHCVYVDEDAIEPLWKGQRFPVAACLSGLAMSRREPVVIEDIYADPRVPQSVYRATFVKSLVMTPIRTVNPLGAIGIYWARRHRATEQEVGLARALADSTAVALESVRRRERLDDARRLARTDELTGIANRRAWEGALGGALTRPATDLHVLLIDLDEFKTYNDTFGHPAGDRFLRDCAAAWTTALRGDDLLARIGGEEFGVLVTGCSAADAFAVAERLRVAVPGARSASIGIASWDGRESGEALMARADRALYAAKAAGRDRTVWAD